MATRNLRDRALGTWAILGALTIVAFATTVWPRGGPQQNKTLQNLQAAYNGEASAHARYTAFADRAQDEEYYEVASLFRAVAYSEYLHMQNFATLIRQMGGEAVPLIERPVVKTTEENLRASAEQNEAYERDIVYPTFIEEAKVEANEDAVRVFEFAQIAEAQHSKLFEEALATLKNTGAESHSYYVCNMCGFTAEHPVKPCPGCSDPKATYVQIF